MVSLYDIWRGDVIPLSGIKMSIGRNTYDGAAPAVPVNDIHTRILNVYDGDSASGVLTFNSASSRLDLVMNDVPVHPIVTAIMAEVYDNDVTGTYSFTTGGAPVALRQTSVNTFPALFVTGGSSNTEITINANGLFEICWRTTAIDDGSFNRPSIYTTWLEENSGGGFAEVQGTRSYCAMSQDGNGVLGAGTTNGSTLINVLNGNIYRIMIDNLSGATALMVQYGSSFRIKKMS